MTPLSFAHRKLLKNYFQSYSPQFSEFTFSNLWMWNNVRPTFFLELEDTLQFFIQDKEGSYALFGPPFGPLSQELILEKIDVELSRAYRTTLPKNGTMENWKFKSNPDQADYVHLVSTLTHFKGHHYQKKRQLIHGCINRYDCEFEPIDSNNLVECAELTNTLYSMQKENSCTKNEREANDILFSCYNDFDLFGGLIKIGGKVESFLIAKELNFRTAVGHAMKSSKDFYGLSTLMIHWFSKYMLSPYTFFNVEQDLGISGLRQFKQSFYPDHLTLKYDGQKVL